MSGGAVFCASHPAPITPHWLLAGDHLNEDTASGSVTGSMTASLDQGGKFGRRQRGTRTRGEEGEKGFYRRFIVSFDIIRQQQLTGVFD